MENVDKKSILTVGVVIKKGGKVLLVRHGEEADHLTGTYGLPAGRVKPGEDLLGACIREVKEETGLTIDKKDLSRLSFQYSAFIERKGKNETFVIIPFTATKFSGNLVPTEETTPEWFDIKEIKKLNLLPNIEKIVEEAFKK